MRSEYFLAILISIFLFNSACENSQNPKIEEEWLSLGLENEIVTAIAVDPNYPEIIYAGTSSDYSAGISGKLFISTDSGETWDTLLVGGSYRNILIDPSNPNILYTLPGAIIKSEDGGQTWQTIIEGINLNTETRVQSIAMNPKNSDVLYAGTGGFYGGNLYKSYNGGINWIKVQSDSLREGITDITIDPIDTNNIYVGTAWRGILWKSANAGENWYQTGLGETGFLINDIFINPEQPSTLYAGINGVFRSENGGKNWSNISQGLPTDCYVIQICSKVASRIFIVEASEEYSGVFEYSFQKEKWTKIGTTKLPISTYSDLSISPNDNKLYFGGKGIYVLDLNE